MRPARQSVPDLEGRQGPSREDDQYLFNGEEDAIRKNAFKHAYYTGLLVHSGRTGYRSMFGVSLGKGFADAHESVQRYSRDLNERRCSNMDLHNNEQGYYWSRNDEGYRRNETAVCNAMRNRADVAARVSEASASTSWPREAISCTS